MSGSITISKHPALSTAEDYGILRQKGLEYIQQLGSKLWTDYNIHDPGITILELLCYALTDLGYRTSLDIKDLMAVQVNETPDHRRQGFYTAREILTINPWTTRDFRKLLIDIDGIKNGWLQVKQTNCSPFSVYVNCLKSKLQYSPATNHAITIKGMYDVMVEFEDNEGMGNLNSGKIFYNFNFKRKDNGNYTSALIELRLPSWQDLNNDTTGKYKNMRMPNSVAKEVAVSFISGNKQDDVPVPTDEFANVLRRVHYVTAAVAFLKDKNVGSSNASILFEDLPMRVWFKSDTDRKQLDYEDLKRALEDKSPTGIFGKYFELVHEADDIIKETKTLLHDHRNLCEDYCTINAVAVEDIAICADIEVEPDADIEAVLAEAYYLIDQYLSPDIKFYSLKELLDKGTPTEEIFEGPALSNGFIDNEQVDSTNLRKNIYTSDVLNLLMDIKGVVSIKNFLFTKYDKEGNQNGASAEWEMVITVQHQPRFYAEASKFLVFKNGLTFLPDKTELRDVLQVIKGRNLQPKFSGIENDMQIPEGNYYNLKEYYPIQYQLPFTYGVSEDGLPGTASVQRVAQAKQLKAYLMFFEQVLINYLGQLSSLKEMFAIDDTVTQTYFGEFISNDILKNAETELYNGLTATIVQNLSENNTEFLDRRNRFLDHMLARFGESFSEYALMLYTYTENKAKTQDQLIIDKVEFLKDISVMSHDRARAFNYKKPGAACSDNNNTSGLRTRIKRLLDIKDFNEHFELYEEHDVDNKLYERRWRLKDTKGKIYLSSSTRYYDDTLEEANEKAAAEINVVKKYITNPTRYQLKEKKKWVLNLTDETGEVIATRKQHFATKKAAEDARDEIIEFAEKMLAAEKIYLVEHLLLRPRVQPQDSLMTICTSANCSDCGEDDPYSFRMTIVLGGEAGLANSGIGMRRFAEKTIREEVPAHLGVKICWVKTDQMIEFEKAYCAWLTELAKEETNQLLLTKTLNELLIIFENLKSVYPPASLHDCEDGNDENRVYLNQSIITSLPPKK
jgi:hypothetical protein